jgi:hypothetical protein
VHFPEHFWSTEYVDPGFVRELAENYYRTSTFIFGDGQGLIGKFLNTDQLNLGFPPKELVSDIEVRLSAITHDRGSFRAYIFGVPKPPERLQGALEGLVELKAGSSVCIQFSTEAKNTEMRQELFVGALPVLFKKLQVTALASYRMRFVLDCKYEFRMDGDVSKKLEEGFWDVSTSMICTERKADVYRYPNIITLMDRCFVRHRMRVRLALTQIKGGGFKISKEESERMHKE